MPIIPEVLDCLDELSEIRRDIHAHPELCFQEVRTADIVAAKLTEWGIPIHRGLGKTGVVGQLGSGDDLVPRELVLRDVQLLSVAETAAILGITTGNVKVRLLRARLQMRDRLVTELSGWHLKRKGK